MFHTFLPWYQPIKEQSMKSCPGVFQEFSTYFGIKEKFHGIEIYAAPSGLCQKDHELCSTIYEKTLESK